MNIGKHALSLLTLGALAVTVQQASAITFTTYTSRALWEAAVGPYSEENFADVILEPGLSFSTTGGGHTGLGVSGGVFNDRLISGSSTTWAFGGPIIGAGANWDLTPGGAGHGLLLLGDGTSVGFEIANTYAGGFFGVKADVAFALLGVKIGSSPAAAETYKMDNLVWSSASVPDGSSTLVLLASAFGLLSFVARRLRL